MSIPDLTPTQREELRIAFEAMRLEFAPQHRATGKALLSDVAPDDQQALGAWLEALFELADEVAAWSLAAQQTDVPELGHPTSLPRLQTLAALPLAARVQHTVLNSSERLGDARVLALAVFIAKQQSEGLETASELARELTRTQEVEATWALLDWFTGAHEGVLQALAERRNSAQHARLEAQRTQDDDATRWLAQRGFTLNEPFAVSIRMQDLPASHPKQRHLREQVSSLDLRITTMRVRGPELDESWALVLRAGSGEPKFNFTPCLWSGELRQPASLRGEVRGVFTEAAATRVHPGRRHDLSATLETLPQAIDAIEALTARSFHCETAVITAHSGARRMAKLEEATRSWLLGR
jgi:hypothetical protein